MVSRQYATSCDRLAALAPYMRRFQLLLELIPPTVAVAIVATLSTAKPSWQLGLLQALLALAAPACACVVVMNGGGLRKAFFVGVSIPAAFAALLFLNRFAQCAGPNWMDEGGEAYGNVDLNRGLTATTSLFKIVLMLWGLSPVVGALCVLTYWFAARSPQPAAIDASHLTSRRRWPQFSLRTFFVLITVLAVWLGIVVNQAREQREAVKAFEALGGKVRYDWQQNDGMATQPGGPEWLRRLIGDDYFQIAEAAYCPQSNPDIIKSIPHLQRLRGLKTIVVGMGISAEAWQALEEALPDCEVIGVGA